MGRGEFGGQFDSLLYEYSNNTYFTKKPKYFNALLVFLVWDYDTHL